MTNPFWAYLVFVRSIERAKGKGRTDESLRAAKERHELQLKMLRPARYEMIDGSGEIGWGMSQLCFAPAAYASVFLPNSRAKTWLPWLLMVSACIAMPLSRWLIKKFITWPRTGYAVRRRDKSSWITIVTSVVVAAGISIAMGHLLRPEMNQAIQAQIQSRIHHSGVAAPGELTHNGTIKLAVYVVSSAMMYLMMSASAMGKHPWKWFALTLMVLGLIGISLGVPGNFNERMRPLGLFAGVVWTVSGGIVFLSYLRHSHPPDTELV